GVRGGVVSLPGLNHQVGDNGNARNDKGSGDIHSFVFGWRKSGGQFLSLAYAWQAACRTAAPTEGSSFPFRLAGVRASIPRYPGRSVRAGANETVRGSGVSRHHGPPHAECDV